MSIAILLLMALVFVACLWAIASGNASVTLSNRHSINKANSGSLNATAVEQNYSTTNQFTSIGAGALAFNEIYCAVRTLAGGASETLDLYGGLTNEIGDTINFARIKSISIELLTTTTASSITVGNAASNPWTGPLGGTTPTITIRNGGFFAASCSDATGFTVTNASADSLKVLNNDGSNTATYRLTLIGALT